MSENTKKIFWYNLAFMAFSTVWSFFNIINGFSNYHGLQAIGSWLIVFALYFVPYALMVGELGSTYKTMGGGVSSWIRATMTPKLAYYAGWTYFIVHVPYIANKPLNVLLAAGWAVFRDKRVSTWEPWMLQILGLCIFFFALFIAGRGINPLKKLATLAGSCMFFMSLLFIVMMIAAPSITGAQFLKIDWSIKSFAPKLDVKWFGSLSILIYAVGGCEKISPYVNKMKNPSRDFPKGMIMLTIMVAVTAVFGTIALGMMFDSENIPNDLVTNGEYYAFQLLGEHYGLGNIFVTLYGITNAICQCSTLVISIDAPLRILLENSEREYIPDAMFKKNKYDAYTNGHRLIAIIVAVIMLIPALGINDVNSLVKWFVKLNSVCMPLRYLWVFAAYFSLKKYAANADSEYKFVSNRLWGMLLGGWCFLVTLFACINGMYSPSAFQFAMNMVTPFVLIGLGLIMPKLAAKNRTGIKQQDRRLR